MKFRSEICQNIGSPHFAQQCGAIKMTVQAESIQSSLNNPWGELQSNV